MSPDAAIAEELRGKLLMSIGWEGALIGVIVLACIVIWWMDAQFEKGCDQCAHCLDKRRRKEAEQRRLSDEYARTHGLEPRDHDDEDLGPPATRA